MDEGADELEDDKEDEEDLDMDTVGVEPGESEIIEDVSGMTADGRKKQRRQTMPFMTKYERARIIGARAYQIAMNAPVMVTPPSLHRPPPHACPTWRMCLCLPGAGWGAARSRTSRRGAGERGLEGGPPPGPRHPRDMDLSRSREGGRAESGAYPSRRAQV
jgi:hypothetical protein